MDDNWDLQALVRSCTGTTASSSSSAAAPAAATTTDHADFDFSYKYFVSFPDPSIEPRGADVEAELHDLYKPFYPKSALSTTPAQAPESIATSSVSSLCFSSDLTKKLQSHHHYRIADPALTSPLSFTTTAATAATTTTTRSSQVNRSKRRKNLVKKVKHVDADELSSDVWSWRKYGQKPIKGSPYPRGYYRCSSSKGCLARKQVERNRSDPGKFIVTYTAEHNHPVPTHRNSLAGSTRQKPSTPPPVSPAKPTCSSPSTSLSELGAESTGKLESGAELEYLMEGDEDGEFGLSDMTVSDDFFAGLEELAGPVSVDSFSDPFAANMAVPWAAAGGGGVSESAPEYSFVNSEMGCAR